LTWPESIAIAVGAVAAAWVMVTFIKRIF